MRKDIKEASERQSEKISGDENHHKESNEIDNLNPEWMRHLDPRLHVIPLNRLLIPGSHDSGAYILQTQMGIAVDRPDLQRNTLITMFSLVTFPIINAYSVTQSCDVYAQLRSGVRYLDIRIGLNPKDHLFYIVHNFYGPPLVDILKQIKLFMEHHPNEVLVLDIQHVWGVNCIQDYQHLLDYFTIYFGDYAYPRVENIPTLRDFWNQSKQVLLCWRAEIPLPSFRLPSEFWLGSDCLLSPWPNTTSPKEMKKFLVKALAKHSITDSRLFVTQGVLTPNMSFVLCNLFGNLSRLTLGAHKVIRELMLLFTSDDDDDIGDKDHEKKTERKQNEKQKIDLIKRANIVMFDFVHQSSSIDGTYLTRLIINSNRLLLLDDSKW